MGVVSPVLSDGQPLVFGVLGGGAVAQYRDRRAYEQLEEALLDARKAGHGSNFWPAE